MLLGIIVLPIAVLVLVNLLDEDLDPRAAAYGAPRAASVPEAENAYYAMLAMNASDGADGIAYARAWLNEVKAAASENRKEKLPESPRAKRPELCDSRQTACLALLRDKADEVSQQLEAYKEDLARYETLLGYKRFEEVLDFQMRVESSLPSYAGLLNAQRAYLLRIGLDIEAGKLEKAVVALEREFAFQRMVLGNSHSLLGKMISVASYWRALQFVNELTEVYADELSPYMQRMSNVLKPLEPPALSIANWAEMEFGNLREASQSYESLEQQYGKVPLGRIGHGLLFKRNATLNRGYRFFSGIVPPLNATADRIEGELNVYERMWLPTWDYIYNPVGKIMTNIMPNYYALRLHDLDALRRLLALRVEMLIAGVGVEQAPGFIANSDARFQNPYTRKPMGWDAEKKRMYFDASGSYVKQFKQGVEGGRVFVVFRAVY